MRPQEISEELIAKGKRIISAIRYMEIVDKTDKITWNSILNKNVPGITESEQNYLYENELDSELRIIHVLLPDATKQQIQYIFATYSFRDFLFNQAACLLVGACSHRYANNDNKEGRWSLVKGEVPNLTENEYKYIQNKRVLIV